MSNFIGGYTVSSEPSYATELRDWLSMFSGEDRYTVLPEYYSSGAYLELFEPSYIAREFDGDLLRACSENPILHAYYLEGYKLRDYQCYMMDRLVKERYVHALWGRRMGKSLSYKLFAHWAMHWNKYPQGGDKSTKIIVIAHTQDSGESYIAELNDYIQIGDKQVAKLFKGRYGSNYFSKRLPLKGTKGKKVNQSVMQYYNVDGSWSSIEVYPPTTRARGRPASVIMMDEVAFWSDYTPDEYKIYRDVIRPIVTDQPNCKIFGATTPNGAKGLSYDLMPIDEHKTIFKMVWYPFFYRREESYLRDIKDVYDEYRNMGAYDSFRQEYLAELVSSKGSYFSNKEIENVFDGKLGMTLRSSLECSASVDFGGKTISRTVINVNIKVKGKDIFGKDAVIVHRIYHKRYPLNDDSTLQQDMLDIDNRFHVIKWHLDSQGGGSAFYSWARKNFGVSRLDEVNFRAEKVDMYRLFKIACYQGRVKSYYDKELFDEFNAFTSDLKPSKGYTDDLLDSFVIGAKDWIVTDVPSSFKSYSLRKGALHNKGSTMNGRLLVRR